MHVYEHLLTSLLTGRALSPNFLSLGFFQLFTSRHSLHSQMTYTSKYQVQTHRSLFLLLTALFINKQWSLKRSCFLRGTIKCWTFFQLFAITAWNIYRFSNSRTFNQSISGSGTWRLIHTLFYFTVFTWVLWNAILWQLTIYHFKIKMET